MKHGRLFGTNFLYCCRWFENIFLAVNNNLINYYPRSRTLNNTDGLFFVLLYMFVSRERAV